LIAAASSLDSDFLAEFKLVTEEGWRTCSIDPAVSGFQFRPGTRWNPGLSDESIREYQQVLGVRFPDDLKEFFRTMNGTDLPTLNVYAMCGHPPRQSVGVYSYPRDLEAVQMRIEDTTRNRAAIIRDLGEQGFLLPPGSNLLPIFAHRYVVCGDDPGSSAVLSIVVDGVDAIVYAPSLREYLKKEFLESCR
jgi:hypothetical protein